MARKKRNKEKAERLPPRHYSSGPIKKSQFKGERSSIWRDIPYRELHEQSLFDAIKAPINFNVKNNGYIYAYRIVLYGVDRRTDSVLSSTVVTMSDPEYKAPKNKTEWASEEQVTIFYDYIGEILEKIGVFLEEHAYFEPEFLRIIYMGKKEKVAEYRKQKTERKQKIEAKKKREKQRQTLVKTRLTKQINAARASRGLPKLTPNQRRKLHAGKITALELI